MLRPNITSAQKGFAHPILLGFLVITVLAVVGFSGYRVLSKNRTTPVATTAPAQIYISPPTASEAEKPAEVPASSEVTIKSPGSAAVSSVTASKGSAAPSGSSVVVVPSQYDVSTPLGSLSQLIYETSKGSYGNALYFVTPGFVSRAYAKVGTQDVSQFANACKTNSVCSQLSSYSYQIDPSHINEETCASQEYAGFQDCKYVKVTFTIEGTTLKTQYYKTVGYHAHKLSVKMLKADGATNWVIDGVSIDNFSL